MGGRAASGRRLALLMLLKLMMEVAIEGRRTLAESCTMNPAELALCVMQAWELPAGSVSGDKSREVLLDQRSLEHVLATAFQASLLREEGRPVTFRLLLQSPERVPVGAGPPEGVHRLVFEKPRPFTTHELRRLTPAVDYDRSLVGVHANDAGELQIWGIVQSGPRWLEQFHGGRGTVSNLPNWLIVGVRNPGYMVISRGSRPLCTLEAGAVQSGRFDVFKSQWLRARFKSTREELMQLHTAARSEQQGWAAIDPDLTRMVTQQMVQRLISTVQRSRHGGTLLIVPGENRNEFTRLNALLRLKYKFKDEEPRLRFRSLIVRVMSKLAALGPDLHPDTNTVGWDDYGHTRDRELTDLDEAIFEMSHMIATLTAVDGAVALTRRFELLGFGGEIAGSLAEVPTVARALDLEGSTYTLEATEEEGTRHRSVYRLCSVLHDVMAMVISQDGGARFIRWKDSQVMYWNHSSIVPT